jgi:hypothetical protein
VRLSSYSSISSVDIKIKYGKGKGNSGRNNNKKAWKTRRITWVEKKFIAFRFMGGCDACALVRRYKWFTATSVYRWAVKYYKYKPSKYAARGVKSIEVETVRVTRMKFVA